MFAAFQNFVLKYFWVLFLAAVIYGLVLPESASWFYGGLGIMIFGATYLVAIDIEYKEMKSIKHYRKEVILFFLVQMVILPIIVYFLMKGLSVDLAEGLFLLCAAPAGVTAISFTRIMGGNSLLALCLTLICSFLIPISLPLLSKYVLQSTIDINAMSMFIDLVIYCAIPFLLGYLTQVFLPKVAKAVSPHIDVISIIIIAFMIAGPVGENAEVFLSIPIVKLLGIVAILFILAFIFVGVGRNLFAYKTKKERIAGGISKCFMNISLATVIAATYFRPEVLLIVILYEFPWDLMLIPVRYIIDRTKKN